MIKYLLLDLSDNLVIFLFLVFTIDFNIVLKFDKKIAFKLIAGFLSICIFSYILQNDIPNILLRTLIGIITISLIWIGLFSYDAYKTISAVAFIFIFNIVIQSYIPVVSNRLDISILELKNNLKLSFLYALPSRIIEFVCLFFIYRSQKNKWNIKKAAFRLLSVQLTNVTETISNTATWAWIYQPKEPKGLKKFKG